LGQNVLIVLSDCYGVYTVTHGYIKNQDADDNGAKRYASKTSLNRPC